MSLGLARFLDPHVAERILFGEGEQLVDEVRRHWVTRIVPVTEIVAGMGLFLLMPLAGHVWWLPLMVGLCLGIHGFWRMHVEFMDRFVVTNFRVFRVHGVIDQRFGMMPLSRVLDIAMRQPFWGQVLGYGHLEIENAAQEQAVREIKFVPDAERRQRLMQIAILRHGKGQPMDRDSEYSSGT